MAIAVLAALAIGWFGRHWFFFYDEWGTILYRREGGLDAFLPPHNGHLQAVMIGIYRVLFSTVGLNSYTPYLWTCIALQLACGAAFYAYARQRVQPELALLMLIPILFMAQAWEILFWLGAANALVAIEAFIAILLVRDTGWPRRDWLVALLLTVALASGGVGVPVTVGVALDGLLRREPLRRLWAVVVPASLYATWFFLYRPVAEVPRMLRELPGAAPHGDIGVLDTSIQQLDRVAHFVLQLAKATANGVLGLDPATNGGLALVAIFLGLAVVTVQKRRINPRLVALLGTLATYWLTIGVTRAGVSDPTLGHYIYPAAVLILLLTVEAMAGMPVRRLGIAAATLVIAGVLAKDVAELRQISNASEAAFARNRADLQTLERNRGRVPPSFAPDPDRLPFVTAGTYFPAIDALGSPVDGVPPSR